MNKIVIIVTLAICTLTSNGQQTGTFTDPRDGARYKTVEIGGQTWFAGNLAFKADSGCWAYDNNMDNLTTYGYLYDWKTAQDVCPAGWHLPSDSIWTILIDFLGGQDSAGKKLRSTIGWSNESNGTNSHGFLALPGGFRDEDGVFKNLGYNGWWWTATHNQILHLRLHKSDTGKSGDTEILEKPAVLDYTAFAISRGMNSNFPDMLRYYMHKKNAYSVRCVKGEK
jgi:uncharacterized protein (TIGR02145 family)